MSMTVSAAALANTLATQQTGTAGTPSAGVFDDILSGIKPTVEENKFTSAVANYGTGNKGLPSPWEQYPANTLTPEKLNELARELKVQADTRSIANQALHKVLDGIQDTARTLTRQS